MNPACISLDTLTASLISIIASIIVGVMVFIIQQRMRRADREREDRERRADDERTREREKRAAEHRCIASIARVEIVEMADRYAKAGSFPYEARRTFDALYDSYKAMGEDGLIDETAERARALPMHPESWKEGTD